MSKRVSISLITIAILLIFAGFLFYTAGTADDKNAGENTESAGSDSETGETGSDDLMQNGQDDSVYAESEDSAADVRTDDSEIPVSAGIDPSAKYIILARDGNLVVFYSDGTTEYFDTGIKVMSLPEETIDQVVTGIPFTTEEELFAFLESYSS